MKCKLTLCQSFWCINKTLNDNFFSNLIFGLAGRYGDVILTKTKPTDKLGIFESLSSSFNDSTFKTFCCNGLCDEEVNCENVSKFPREHDL